MNRIVNSNLAHQSFIGEECSRVKVHSSDDRYGRVRSRNIGSKRWK